IRSFDISDRPHFQEMLRQRNFVVSEIIMGRLSKRPIVAAELPIIDTQGRIERVIGLGADLERLDEIAVDARKQFNGLLLVLDNGGRIIAHLPKLPNGEISHEFDEPDTIRVLVRADTPIVETTESGIKRIYGMKQLPNGQTIAVGLDRDTVLEPVERSFRADLLFLLLIAAGSVTAALLVAEFGVVRVWLLL